MVSRIALEPGKKLEYYYLERFISNLPKGIKILDAGCGDGKLVRIYEDLGYDVWGIDVLPLDKADKVHLKGAPIRPEKFRQEDMRKLSFGDKTFDVIYCIQTLINIGLAYGGPKDEKTGDRKAIEEFMRVLKDDGLLFVTLAYGEACIKPRVNSFRVYDDARLKKLFEGWEILDSHYFYFNFKSKMWIETKDKALVRRIFHKDKLEWCGNSLFILQKQRD